MRYLTLGRIIILLFWVLISQLVLAQRPAQGPLSTDKFDPVNHGYSLVWVRICLLGTKRILLC